jgi:cytochrome c oxidase subunit 1
MLAFQPIFIFNFIRSMFKGALAGANPWRANTLEWLAPSPPPHGNFAELPVVYRGPYEYSVEDREEDFWPQHIPDRMPTPAETAVHSQWQA